MESRIVHFTTDLSRRVPSRRGLLEKVLGGVWGMDGKEQRRIAFLDSKTRVTALLSKLTFDLRSDEGLARERRSKPIDRLPSFQRNHVCRDEMAVG